jgi:TolB-like protein
VVSPRPSPARLVALLLVPVLLGAGRQQRPVDAPAAGVVVFPVENLTGGNAPTEAVRQFLIGRLVSANLHVLTPDALDEFMARHRVRYAAGIDAETAAALRKETGVANVIIPTIELSIETAPPKVGILARLVSIADAPTVAWAADEGLSGDDAPGLFELGVVNDYEKLQTRALSRIADSLIAHLTHQPPRPLPKTSSKFRPRFWYRHLTLEADRPPVSVAVMPFINLSGRRNAGEILSLLFMGHLSRMPQFRVIDAGVLRRELLNARIIMNSGLSITDADTVGALIDADYVLGGRVLRYEDHEGAGARTRVEFSALLVDRKSRLVVWSSDSAGDGTDGALFFDLGRTRTAHAMATGMVQIATDMIAGRDR